jgi:hypothetical protein
MEACVRPGWEDVDALLTRLVTTRETFSTRTSEQSHVSQYDPDSRLMVEANNGARWVAVADVKECWSTFERLGRIGRADVLEPGRCSAFMIALFAQVDGVVSEADDVLALPGA